MAWASRWSGSVVNRGVLTTGGGLARGWPAGAARSSSSSLGSAALMAAVIQTPSVSQFFGCQPLDPVG
jgi:hypothetical protein